MQTAGPGAAAALRGDARALIDLRDPNEPWLFDNLHSGALIVPAPSSGYVQRIDAKAVGFAGVALRAGRERKDAIDPAACIYLDRRSASRCRQDSRCATSPGRPASLRSESSEPVRFWPMPLRRRNGAGKSAPADLGGAAMRSENHATTATTPVGEAVPCRGRTDSRFYWRIGASAGGPHPRLGPGRLCRAPDRRAQPWPTTRSAFPPRA